MSLALTEVLAEIESGRRVLCEPCLAVTLGRHGVPGGVIAEILDEDAL